MKIQFLHTLGCKWCIKTEKLLRESLNDLDIKEDFEEIIVDSNEKEKKYKFVGSPTIRINGQDIYDVVSKSRCESCEKLCESGEGTDYTKQNTKSGCRTFIYGGKNFAYPPKGMIKAALKSQYN